MREYRKIGKSLALPSQALINGSWCAARSGATFATKNPATSEVLAHLPACGAADVDEAVAAAQAASRPRVLAGATMVFTLTSNLLT